MISKILSLHTGNCKEDCNQLRRMNEKLNKEVDNLKDEVLRGISEITELKAMYHYQMENLEKENLALQKVIEKLHKENNGRDAVRTTGKRIKGNSSTTK